MGTSFLVCTVLHRTKRRDGSLVVIGRPSEVGSVLLSRGESVEIRPPAGPGREAKVMGADVLPYDAGFESLVLEPAVRWDDAPPGTEIWFHSAN